MAQHVVVLVQYQFGIVQESLDVAAQANPIRSRGGAHSSTVQAHIQRLHPDVDVVNRLVEYDGERPPDVRGNRVRFASRIQTVAQSDR